MQLSGFGIGSGVAVGPVLRMPEPLPEPRKVPRTADADVELAAVVEALRDVAVDLRARAITAGEQAIEVGTAGARAGGVHEAGTDAQDVLEATALMAEDPTLLDDVRVRIDAGATGERAVFDAIAVFRTMLSDLGGYSAERASDLADVSQRVIARLRGVPAPGVPSASRPFVLVARDLAPADTATLDLRTVLAIVTSDGGPTGHTAILARSRSIPALIGVTGALELAEGTVVLVDAASGVLVADPSREQIEVSHRVVETGSLAPGALADGTSIPLLANLGAPEEADAAIALGAEGVGLFRTELLFLDAAHAPSVEEQRERYAALLSRFPGRRVVVRALDAGSDKPLAFLNDAPEENPALGLRGLRALRAAETVLRDQLEALAAADAETDAELWVMAPMVAQLEETEYFVRLAHRFGLRTAGVMVEVPSLALLAEPVAIAADFLSIGTNDLTQYTLAADRTLSSVAGYQDPWHPAVLRLIGMIGDAGTETGTPVGVCGEAAADPDLAIVLVGLGATSLSMAPSALAGVRAALAGVTREQAMARAGRALAAHSAAEARVAAGGDD